jgi:hypothetical protein
LGKNLDSTGTLKIMLLVIFVFRSGNIFENFQNIKGFLFLTFRSGNGCFEFVWTKYSRIIVVASWFSGICILLIFCPDKFKTSVSTSESQK